MDKRQETAAAFRDVVNMGPKTLERWLATDESKNAGDKRPGQESPGHRAGRRIVKILQTRKADLGEGDYEHMGKVVGYVRRSMSRRPKGNVRDSRWRHSLMNWGHDPIKE
ncbi:DUF3140 domain-containing protein [Spongiactinospora sp. TRM90649]|uniref:DUF3140 domain-containing protein n=1 Tax=Spongiactinospora sp. TRM90649 TaxID=3031114 RepID=UPI0023F9C2D1|nr:DUF3140 domain-containing protein [Spongiactinospora sp. TRM90649]MDF5751816.1 DUF3140 domain-containing protein [Spongiactinospora sp. TRM90649]